MPPCKNKTIWVRLFCSHIRTVQMGIKHWLSFPLTMLDSHSYIIEHISMPTMLHIYGHTTYLFVTQATLIWFSQCVPCHVSNNACLPSFLSPFLKRKSLLICTPSRHQCCSTKYMNSCLFRSLSVLLLQLWRLPRHSLCSFSSPILQRMWDLWHNRFYLW